jgi:serine/threonine-protein phosphatase 4 catalytic subunit
VVNNEFSGNFFNYYLEFYKTIPIALYTDTGIFAVHGGIPDNLNDINQINQINRYVYDVIDNDTSLMQLLWNDPTNEVKEFSSSFRGPGIKLFGSEIFKRFISNNNIKLFIRAHEAFLEGYKFFFNNKLLSIFSAANYRAGNEAKLAEIDKKLKINLITVG